MDLIVEQMDLRIESVIVNLRTDQQNSSNLNNTERKNRLGEKKADSQGSVDH